MTLFLHDRSFLSYIVFTRFSFFIFSFLPDHMLLFGFLEIYLIIFAPKFLLVIFLGSRRRDLMSTSVESELKPSDCR